MGSEGKILVRVSAAENAIPLEGVTVVITRRGSGAVLELLGLRSTNADGQTTPVPVSTPDRELSESPSGENRGAAWTLRRICRAMSGSLWKMCRCFPA